MIKNILGCACPSAHVSANKLVLSLPDAMTPVMWVIDLEESKTILLKVHEADNNTFVLQKIDRSGAKDSIAEDIAYYDSKGKAVRALNRTNDALNRQSCGRKNRGVTGCIWYWVKMALAYIILTTLLVYWLLSTQFGTGIFLKMIDMQRDGVATVLSTPMVTGDNITMPAPQESATPTTETPVQPGTLAVTPTSRNPDAIGVPLSADDFIKKQTMGF